MHADSRISDLHIRLQLCHKIVCIQYSVGTGPGKSLFAEAQDVAERPEAYEEITVEHLDPSEGMLRCIQEIGISRLFHYRLRQELLQECLAAGRTASGAAAAVRCGKCFMQVQMNTVKAHVARTCPAYDGIQIGSVIVAKAARLMDNLCDFADIGIKNTQRIRICQHQPGSILTDSLFQRFQIYAAFFIGCHMDNLIACHRGRCRVGSVCRIGNNDLRPLCISS